MLKFEEFLGLGESVGDTSAPKIDDIKIHYADFADTGRREIH